MEQNFKGKTTKPPESFKCTHGSSDLRNGHTIMLDAIQLCHYNRGQNCPKKGLSDPQKEKRKKDCVTISEIKGVYVYI